MLKLQRGCADEMPQCLYRAATGADRETRRPVASAAGYDGTAPRTSRSSGCSDGAASAAIGSTARDDQCRSGSVCLPVCLCISAGRDRAVLWPALALRSRFLRSSWTALVDEVADIITNPRLNGPR